MKKNKFFGRWSVDKELFDWIGDNLSPGKIILELGSGQVSGEFSKRYVVYSIEHDPKWLHKYNTNYIYAPIRNNWYDTAYMKNLPRYDLLLIDGPPIRYGRTGFMDNIHLFDLTRPVVIDDIGRKHDRNNAMNISTFARRPLTVYRGGSKQFGII